MMLSFCERLIGIDPYAGFDPSAYPSDVHGWNSRSPAFEKMILETKPKLIIEIGTWKGASALHMARLCDKHKLTTKIICIDTWLGSLEMWTRFNDPRKYGSLNLRFGYPQIYYEFLANVVRAKQTERIIPLPMPSITAAKLLRFRAIECADLIYVDASHDIADVCADIMAFLPLLKEGGIMFGDDVVSWDSVREGVRAALGNKWDVFGNVWVYRKKGKCDMTTNEPKPIAAGKARMEAARSAAALIEYPHECTGAVMLLYEITTGGEVAERQAEAYRASVHIAAYAGGVMYGHDQGNVPPGATGARALPQPDPELDKAIANLETAMIGSGELPQQARAAAGGNRWKILMQIAMVFLTRYMGGFVGSP